MYQSIENKLSSATINFWSVVIFVTLFRYMLRDEKKEDDDWKSEKARAVDQWGSNSLQ